MTGTLRASALAILALGVLAPAVASRADDALELYRRGLALSQSDAPVCAKGTVRRRLDCLGREIEMLNRRLEDLATPRVSPLGLPNTEDIHR